MNIDVLSDTLARILRDKEEEVAAGLAATPLAEIEKRALDQDAPRDFTGALCAKIGDGRTGLIAEIKRASPSGGLIRDPFEPAGLARAYEAGGAACLSVLTDGPYFQGEMAHMVEARAACALPVIRKDFIVDPYQVIEARALGADAILLIMAALSDAQAAELEAVATAWSMDVLIEVHDAAERDRALLLQTPLLGINNRNLKTLDVSLQTSFELSNTPGKTLVAESGLSSNADLAALAGVGIRTFLVGESLMRQADVEAATRALLQ